MPWAEPFTFLGMRFALAAAILLIAMLARGRARLPHNQALHSIGVGILMQGVYLGGVFWAVHHGMPAGLAGLIAGLQPLITAVLAGTMLGERILPRHWLGLAAGFAGVVIVFWPKLGAAGGGVDAATLSACLAAVLAISVGTIWQKRSIRGGDLVAATFWQYVGGTVMMALGSLLFETRQVTVNGELLFALAWLVLVLSIGAIFLLMVMIRDGETSKVASLFYLVPAVTAILAFFLFGEQLDAIQLAGMAIATVGVGLATAQPPTRARASR
jgi:drug/metabolite transporter (DMT)-like permease